MTVMAAPLDRIVGLLHVLSVPRSINFYAKLGFEVVNSFTPPDSPDPTWAYVRNGGAHLMFGQAEEPVVPSQQGVLFYVYSEKLEDRHRALLEAGVAAGPVVRPFYSPLGEFRVEDPDGYVLIIAHAEEPDEML